MKRVAKDPLAVAVKAAQDAEHALRILGSALDALRDERQREGVVETPGKNLIGPKEVASRLGIDLRTVRRWRHEGRLPPALVIGRSVRWKRAEIERLVS